MSNINLPSPGPFQARIVNSQSGEEITPTGANSGGSVVDLPLTAFADLRTAELLPVTGWTFNYNINSDLITTTLVGSGTATVSNSKAVLQTGAAANSSAAITTISALRYNPGLGGLVRVTAVFTTGVANSTQIIGIGDTTDGFFFGYNGASFGVLRRQNGTDNWIPQSSWNYDRMDGTGPSGVDLDPTLGNVYTIRYQWLGFGAIYFYTENPVTGLPALAHVIQYANTNTNPTVFNPTLPLHAQVINTTNTSNITLQTPSGMGLIEGDGNNTAIITRNSFSNVKLGITTTETSIFTLRNQATFLGKTNRVRVLLDFLTIQNNNTTGTGNLTSRLVRNATLGGTPVYNDISPNTSVMQVDTAGTTVTGGTDVLSTGLNPLDSAQLIISDLGILLDPGSTFTLSAFTSTGTSTVNIGVSWRELW